MTKKPNWVRGLIVFMVVIVTIFASLLVSQLILIRWSQDYSLCRANETAMRELRKAVKDGDWRQVVLLLRTPAHILIDGPNPKEYAALAAMDELLAAGPVAVPALFDVGLESEDPQVRYMSICVVGGMRRIQYADAILKALSAEQDDRVLICGANSLCVLGDTDQARPIVKRVMDEWRLPGVLYGNRLIRGYHVTTTFQLGEYLNRRFRLGVEIPAKFYRYYEAIDANRYPLDEVPARSSSSPSEAQDRGRPGVPFRPCK